ncbi:MAG: AEC family transporter [Hydrogenophaga sp.]|uniref:AEC family transporter n=1 Tax=Hydrogenophaga sp. TaxID=1904254 RepID=UPI00271DA9C5|nr:AEC family transporter [Hydrogenophaga sp.]MDO9572037.1 AEC family transporter [Hydrogenophaga sp.]MDP3376688.1 AEC family transporter [Hydrogenophaga sp.]
MLDILAITGPIYLCIAAGFASVRWSLFSKADMRVFGKFVIQIALPALLFNALASRPLGEVIRPGYLVAFAVGSLVLMLGSLWFAHRVQGKSLTESAYVAMGMTCSNSGYVGYPVMLLLFGPLAGVVLALNLLVENLLKLPVLLALADAGAHPGERVSLGHTLRQTVERLVRNPMIIAIVAGFLVSLVGWQLPSVITRTVTLFSAASGGLALFIIGGTLVGLQVKGLRRQVSMIALGKLLLHPLAVWAAVMVLPLLGLPAVDGDLRAAAVLSAAMPMLGIYAILAQRHGFESFTAAALLATTAISFFTLSGILWLMRHSPGWLSA